ncbi:MAG: hypothetical protein QNL62_05515 [Gammaproteobacteria bacterium]|nr:hypothetical protein [Gammaproteobacteria bacterium]
MGVVNLKNMDTTPGNENPFSPPDGWTGTNDDYITLLRARNKDSCYSQQIYLAAKQRLIEKDVAFSGPFKNIANRMLNSICN